MKINTDVLDGYRALAAFWVVTAHCFIWGAASPLPREFDPKIAVDVFMVLSGFLMMLVTDGKPTSVKDFYLRRFLRIAPLYYVILFVAFTTGTVLLLRGYGQLVALNPKSWAGSYYHPSAISYDPLNLLLHVSFVFGLLPAYSFSTMLPDWSLGLEVQFYAAFPLFLLAARRFGALQTVAVLAAISILFHLLYNSGFVPHFREPSLLPLNLDSFLVDKI